MPIRLATFNVENLFSRAKVLNLASTEDNDELVSAAFRDAESLRRILRKTTYSAVDKTAVQEILDGDSGKFLAVEVDRGKLFRGRTNQVIAGGRADWYGRVTFKRAAINDEATVNTGRVIKALKADAVCVVEVEDRDTLADFNSQVLAAKRFKHVRVLEGIDPRGIDVGLVSNLETRDIRTHIDDPGVSGKPVFARDCTEFELMLPGGRSLWFLCNHFTSKFSDQTGKRRRPQAERVVSILERFDLAQELVAVAGDLNDTPGSDALAPLLNHHGLHNVADRIADAEDRWTIEFRGAREQIDFILVSTALMEHFSSVTIERRGMMASTNRFPEVTTEANAASDHAAMVAEFDL